MDRENATISNGSTVEDDYLEREQQKVLRDVIDSLPSVEAAIIQSLYYEELSLRTTAKVLGYDKSWTCRLHQRAMLRLSTRIKNAMR